MPILLYLGISEKTMPLSKSKFDHCWDIAKKQISEMTVVNNRPHATGSSTSGEVVINMSIVISAKALFVKCEQAALDGNLHEDDIPFFSYSVYPVSGMLAGIGYNFQKSQKMLQYFRFLV